MEHNYEVKTSNRVLTVATGVMGEKQKIFYRLGVFFSVTYLVTERGESGPGLTRVQDCVMF